MKHCIAIVLFAALVSFASARADVHRWTDSEGKVHFSDRAEQPQASRIESGISHTAVTAEKLFGEWIAETGSGNTVSLALRAGGSFVLDREHAQSPERLYLCGNWSADGGSVALDVRTRKEQAPGGEITETLEPSQAGFEVLNATTELLVVRMDGHTLNFHRSGV